MLLHSCTTGAIGGFLSSTLKFLRYSYMLFVSKMVNSTIHAHFSFWYRQALYWQGVSTFWIGNFRV